MELPLSKIKRIAKFDPDVKLVSQEGAVALTLSCEMFIKHIAENVHNQTKLGKRKTVQIRDFDVCLQNTSAFSFLEGILETWSDISGQPGASRQRKEKETETAAADQDDDIELVEEAIGDTEESDGAATAIDVPTNDAESDAAAAVMDAPTSNGSSSDVLQNPDNSGNDLNEDTASS